MNIAVWGAGNIGTGLVRRLAISTYVDEIIWINRNFQKIDLQAADIKHGLAFVQNCRQVHAVSEQHAHRRLAKAEIVVLTHGAGVATGGSRSDVFAKNKQVFKQAIDALAGFRGVVLVVSNPVDLMTREVVTCQPSIAPERIIGLGTVVETARLQSAVAGRILDGRSPKEINAYAIGSHDDRFIPIVCEDAFRAEMMAPAREEVIQAAARVKGDDGATLFPIVEGAMRIIESVAKDSSAILTVSVLDDSTDDHLCYSLPCVLSNAGWSRRDADCVQSNKKTQELAACLSALRATIRSS